MLTKQRWRHRYYQKLLLFFIYFKNFCINKHKWQERDSNQQPLSSQTNAKPFSQTGQMIELCGEHLSVRCIWLYAIIMSHTCFRMNPHSIVCLNVKELFARNRYDIWSLSDSNGIRTHNQLVRKRKLNHLAKLVKWLSCVVSAYLYGAGKSLQSINWVASAATRFFPFNQPYTVIRPSKIDLITRN